MKSCLTFNLSFPKVYEGVPKDYTKTNYTLANLFSVLSGSKPSSGSGKTLKSGPNDNVFLFYADHGAPGLSGFCDETLMATKLNKVTGLFRSNLKNSEPVAIDYFWPNEVQVYIFIIS